MKKGQFKQRFAVTINVLHTKTQVTIWQMLYVLLLGLRHYTALMVPGDIYVQQVLLTGTNSAASGFKTNALTT